MDPSTGGCDGRKYRGIDADVGAETVVQQTMLEVMESCVEEGVRNPIQGEVVTALKSIEDKFGDSMSLK